MSERGVCAILLGDDPDALARELQDRFPRATLIGGDAEFETLVAKVVGFVEAPGLGLDLPLDVRGTAFQQRVWQALREIPAGSTVSYSELARRIGAPGSARAVAHACATNPLAVAIPCHRVVRNDGGLVGLSLGRRAQARRCCSGRRRRERPRLGDRDHLLAGGDRGPHRRAGLESRRPRPRRGRQRGPASGCFPGRVPRAGRACTRRTASSAAAIVMARHGFGRGEYKYFSYPLPEIVAALRTALYPHLAADRQPLERGAGHRRALPGGARGLPRAVPPGRPAPSRRRSSFSTRRSDYNCLHQDVYGEHVFPLQVAILLSEPGRDFTGGEFVMTEQRPRMQSRAEVVPLGQGDAVVFTVRNRPVQGTRGVYRVNLRHGVSRVRSGQRHTVGIIFHDALVSPA